MTSVALPSRGGSYVVVGNALQPAAAADQHANEMLGDPPIADPTAPAKRIKRPRRGADQPTEQENQP